MKDILNALNKHLFALVPSLPTAMENGSFTPQANQPFQVVNLIPNETRTPALLQNYFIERGIYQITVCYPSGTGAIAALDRVEELRAHFHAGLNLQEAGKQIEILGQPSVVAQQISDGWYCVPVRINYKVVRTAVLA